MISLGPPLVHLISPKKMSTKSFNEGEMKQTKLENLQVHNVSNHFKTNSHNVQSDL
jgi:hypothetical protein